MSLLSSFTLQFNKKTPQTQPVCPLSAFVPGNTPSLCESWYKENCPSVLNVTKVKADEFYPETALVNRRVICEEVSDSLIRRPSVRDASQLLIFTQMPCFQFKESAIVASCVEKFSPECSDRWKRDCPEEAEDFERHQKTNGQNGGGALDGNAKFCQKVTFQVFP